MRREHHNEFMREGKYDGCESVILSFPHKLIMMFSSHTLILYFRLDLDVDVLHSLGNEIRKPNAKEQEWIVKNCRINQ